LTGQPLVIEVDVSQRDRSGHRRRIRGVLRLPAGGPQHAVIDHERAHRQQADQRDRDLHDHGAAFGGQDAIETCSWS
jgi:hypothetical protein